MSDRPRNAFLRGLDANSFAELSPHLVPVDLALSQPLFRPDEKVESVYFPEGALISMLTSTAEGQTVETTMIGVEGAAGLLEACGSGHTNLEGFVQSDGRALKAPAGVIRTMAAQNESFARHAWLMIEYQLAESRQSGLCNALHTVEHRLARWLLECAERAGGRQVLPLTQEFLASMLGVQRTTVNTFASQLQKAGLITYSRGKIIVVDAGGLQHSACECRSVTQAQRERLGFTVQTGPAGVFDDHKRHDRG